MGVAVYAESVIPRAILARPTSYILNVCILPTKENDGFENFSNKGIDQLQSLAEFWDKFRKYALINEDQVISIDSLWSGEQSVVDLYCRVLL